MRTDQPKIRGRAVPKLAAGARSKRTPTIWLTTIAQDPSVTWKGGLLTSELEIPAKPLGPGPKGHRVHVIDYDASTDSLYQPRSEGLDRDPYAGVTDTARLVGDHTA